MTEILENLQSYAFAVWQTLESLAMWLFVGLGVAGILHFWVSDEVIKRHLGTGRWLPVFKAALLGVPLPLCSCGVIPAAIGIKKQQASDSAAMSFLVSTPQTGVDSIAVSVAFLGWPFAIFKLLAAFSLGILGGLSLSAVAPEGPESQVESGGSCCTGASCSSPKKTRRSIREFFRFTVDDLLKDIWRWLLIGILISAAVQTWMPPGYLQDLPFMSGVLALIVVMIASLPLYVCATTSVPIAAALVHAGMPPGAALVFLIAGPASNAATMGAIFRSFGGRFLAVYLLIVGLGSILGGYLFDSLISAGPPLAEAGEEEGGMLAAIFAVALIALMLRFAVRIMLIKRVIIDPNSGVIKNRDNGSA